MKKLNMQSLDVIASNVEKIAHLFPNCVTERLNKEGNPELAIDFVKLQAELSNDIIAEGEERYQFTWPDKREAVRLANTPTTMTLRPCRKESVDFDNTQNLYIEGDNLDVLKVLRETYLGKVKMIYIDPPYNTGHDFVYNDDFVESYENYAKSCKAYDEDGNLQFNPKENGIANGRFHTDWLNMIYPRLKVAKDFLTDDGVIFISIGQSEIQNLINVSNEIFGEDNRVAIISRIMKSGGNKGQYFSPNIEYILVYAKNLNNLGYFRESLSDEIIKTYNHIETEGSRKGEKFTIKGLCQPGLGIRPNQRYWIQAPDGTYLIPQGINFPEKIADGEKILPTDADTCWKWTPERYFEEKEKGNIYFHRSSSATALVDETGNIAKWNVFNKIWLADREKEGRVPVDLITKWENRISSSELKELNIPFDFAKPVDLIKYLISIVDNTENATILDFFSGSATTAHSIMKLNAEDDSSRQFIMVQLPETTDVDSDAYKAGYKNICEIGKERIRRAGKKVKEEAGLAGENLDIGFRVLKLDSSNMADVYYTPQESSQMTLLDENVKPDRSNEDLLLQVMLDLGIELSAKIEAKQIAGKTVHFVDGNYLVACFDSDINESTIKEIAKLQPVYFVMRNASAANDNVIDNFEQIFKHYSPDTNCRIL